MEYSYIIEVTIRLLAAVSLGAVLGVERIIAHKSAGVRTYALVSMGAAFFMILSELLVASYVASGVTAIQPTYVLAQIVVAIGFLSGGLFLKHDDHVSGLTTASGIWITAAIGSAAGLGQYAVAAIATGIVLFVFTILWAIEQSIRKYADKKKMSKNC